MALQVKVCQKWDICLEFVVSGRRWPLKIRQLRDICFQQDKENIVFIMIVSRGRLQETTCFHTTVRIYPAKSGTGNILFSIWSFHKSGHIRQGAKLFSEIILLQPFVRRAPHLVPRRVTSPLLWKHWATNETIFTKFGFKSFPFWPIEGGLHFCWLEKREFCYWTPVKYFKKYIS